MGLREIAYRWYALYFCEVHWPGFREVDFLRTLRSYAARRRAT